METYQIGGAGRGRESLRMNTPPRPFVLCLFLCATAPTFAQSMLFDFGSTAATSSAARLNSPGHAAGDVSASETTWNQVQTADISSGLKFSDGTAATGVGIDLGTETTSTSNIIGFLTQPNSSLQGTNPSYATGIYDPSDSPARDFIYNSANNEPWAIGLKLTGLEAGVYRIYINGANVHGASAGTMNFYASTLASGATTYDFSGATTLAATNLSSGASSWTAGVNYVVFSVTLTAGQDLAIAASGEGTSSGGRGFLNSLELVRVGNIPEPGAFAVLAGACALLAAGCRRRNRN